MRYRNGSNPMSHIELTATVTFWAAASFTLFGCGQSPQGSSQNRNPKTDIADDDVKRSETFVTCRATFTAIEKNYPWFDDSSFGHDNGRAPLATFVLAEPATYADRSIGILFKYSANTVTTSPPDQADIGRQFVFQIPEDALQGKYRTIDNASVRHFRKIEP
jgi:hypothetical protein